MSRTTSRASTAAFASAVMVLACSVAAFAQPAGQQAAKAIVDDAVSQYNLGHFAEASTLFEKAYQLDPAPILLFNIGQCHRRLGNHELALFFYRRYLEQAAPNAAERPDVGKRVADLERTIREQADLKDKPPPGVGRDIPANEGKPAGGGAITPPIGPPPVIPPVREEDHSRHTLRRLAWLSGGLAAASLVFGGIEAVVWANRTVRFDDHMGPSPGDPAVSVRDCGVDAPNRGGAGCAGLYDDLSSARTLAIAGLTAGGLLAASSVLLFLTSRPSDVSSSSVAAACGPDLSTAGMTCRLSF